MTRRPPIFALLLGLALVGAVSARPAAADDHKPAEGGRHLFILSGQSNMAGLRPERGFLPELDTLLPDADIQHIKVAKGGQPIRHWVEDWNTIAEEAGLELKEGARIQTTRYYQPIIDQAAAIREDGGDFDSVTFLWMQGERDAKENLADAYTPAFTALIAALREDLDAPDMGVVIGRLSDYRREGQWEQVRLAHVAMAEADEHGAWVDTDDLNDKVKNEVERNDLHYTAEGYELFGRRLARQAVRLIQGEEPADDGRPE